MKLVDTICPSCGATLTIDQENKAAYCTYCGNRLIVDDEIQRTRLDDAEQTGYLFERGRQRAIAEAATREVSYASATPEPAPSSPAPKVATPDATLRSLERKPRKTWLWVLGWLLFFPLPLAILVMRHFEKDPDAVEIDVIYVLRALAWVLGWFYVFPIPLTILMLRNDTLSTSVRYGAIAAGWIAYLIIFIIPSMNR